MTLAKRLTPCLLLLAWLTAGGPAAQAEESATSPEAAAKFVQDLGSRAVALFASYAPAEAEKLDVAARESTLA